MDGQGVCPARSGPAPQTVAAAKLRLAALVNAAVGVLAHAMKQKAMRLPSAIRAARDALGRAGQKPRNVIEVNAPAQRIASLQAGRERARRARAEPVPTGHAGTAPHEVG